MTLSAVCPPALARTVTEPTPLATRRPPGSTRTTPGFVLEYSGTTFDTSAPAESRAVTLSVIGSPAIATSRVGNSVSCENDGDGLGEPGGLEVPPDPPQANATMQAATNAHARYLTGRMILTLVPLCIPSTHGPSAERAHACAYMPTHTENGQQAILSKNFH